MPKILVLAASLRPGSLNSALADIVAHACAEGGAEVTRLNPADYEMPIYTTLEEEQSGLPQAALALHAQFRGHDGIFIASPEYNAFPAPLLVNWLTWLSRVTDHGGKPAAFEVPVFAIGSASPGGFGGYRGLMALRNQLELAFGARVLPAMVSIANAQAAIGAGTLQDPRAQQMCEMMVAKLLEAAA
ncbi:NADPH-dependent FMN reductase [Thioclava sp. F28-4]|uniref:NADPH-dependent FMN reductase n=1 Tax=Thioclava sp. F28-4 TaxID=1915315 RepID=UPI000995EE59|nr:NAD(P)H-dependent oxidoreductase [Thioclava sp. F28-4]